MITPGQYKRKESAERAEIFAALYSSGMSLAEIGRQCGLSRERVRQIVYKTGVFATDCGIKSISSGLKKERKDSFVPLKSGIYLEVYGCTLSEIIRLNGELLVSHKDAKSKKYAQQRKGAGARGISWEITFPEWVEFWGEKYNLRGGGKCGLVMCRNGDAGPYKIGNIYLVSCGDNVRDYFKEVSRRAAENINRGHVE